MVRSRRTKRAPDEGRAVVIIGQVRVPFAGNANHSTDAALPLSGGSVVERGARYISVLDYDG